MHDNRNYCGKFFTKQAVHGTHLVRGIHSRAGLQQRFDHTVVAVVGRTAQRRPAILQWARKKKQ